MKRTLASDLRALSRDERAHLLAAALLIGLLLFVLLGGWGGVLG